MPDADPPDAPRGHAGRGPQPGPGDAGLTPTTRLRHGRWLGGVCAGLEARWGIPAARSRLAFALTALLGGLGALAYLAAWLILPLEGGQGSATGQRAIVVLAQGVGGVIGLAVLAVAAGAATVFGFGWVVVAIAAACLVGALVSWPRVGPGWALLPLGALVVPSVALAAGGVRIDPRTSPQQIAPRTVGELPRGGLRSGLGTLQLDLRKTALPTRGVIDLRIRGGVRRTLVALPHDRCVHVEVAQHVVPFATRAAAVALGRSYSSTPGAVVFGQLRHDDVVLDPVPEAPGPTLRIEYSSEGGGLVVRDFPDDVDPGAQPNWPGYYVYPEQEPDTTGMTRAVARQVLRDWRARHAGQLRSARAIEDAMGGPCVRAAAKALTRKARRG
jgi:phage shock protein PspC (stress-responsive transcriptional regulator)